MNKDKFYYHISYPGRDDWDFDIKYMDSSEFVTFLNGLIDTYESVTFVCQADIDCDEQMVHENVKDCWEEEKITYLEDGELHMIGHAIIMNTELGKTMFFENGNNSFTSIYCDDITQ